MQKFLFLLLIISSFVSHSQQESTTKKRQHIKELVFDDSTIQKLQQLKDSGAKTIQLQEANQARENISRNADGILQLEKEQTAKKKKAAIVRIGIGAALLAVLIIGLGRRKK